MIKPRFYVLVMILLSVPFAAYCQSMGIDEKKVETDFLSRNESALLQMSVGLEKYTVAREELKHDIFEMDKEKLRATKGFVDLIKTVNEAIAISDIYCRNKIPKLFNSDTVKNRIAFKYKELWIVVYLQGNSFNKTDSYSVINRNTGEILALFY